MDDYFGLEPLITTRLKEHLGESVRDVYSARDLATLLEGRVNTPAVYVLFYREVVPQGEASRTRLGQLVDQHWLIVLAVKRRGDPLPGAREEAGPLLASINRALQGWDPDNGYGVLRKASSPGSDYDDSGLNLFSLVYASQVAMLGDG